MSIEYIFKNNINTDVNALKIFFKNFDIYNNDNKYVLFWCLNNKKAYNLIDYFIKYTNADVNLLNKNNENILNYINNPELIKYIITHTNININNLNGLKYNCLFTYIIRTSNIRLSFLIKIVKSIIMYTNLNINNLDIFDQNVLSKCTNIEIIKLLNEYSNVDFNIVNCFNKHILHNININKKINIVLYLIKYTNININTIDCYNTAFNKIYTSKTLIHIIKYCNINLSINNYSILYTSTPKILKNLLIYYPIECYSNIKCEYLNKLQINILLKHNNLLFFKYIRYDEIMHTQNYEYLYLNNSITKNISLLMN